MLGRVRRRGATLPLRVLVCGSRDFADRGRVEAAMLTISGGLGGRVVVITGAARGADALGAAAARHEGLQVIEFPADRARHQTS
ncbi:MAG: SLOG family protein [Actinomycetota bacterium]|nr:SLOG family protein [Actinomycetota bacterium]